MKPNTMLEHVAAGVLALVLLSLGWMMLVATHPRFLRLPSEQAEVLLVVGLLTAALILVSVVALRQTE